MVAAGVVVAEGPEVAAEAEAAGAVAVEAEDPEVAAEGEGLEVAAASMESCSR